MKTPSPRALIFFTIFIDLLGFGIVIPILPKIAHEAAGGNHPALMAGLMLSSYSFFQMIFSPIWGRLSDRIGRRPVIMVSLVGSVVAYTMFAFCRSYEMLLVSRMFAGICGANIAAAQAYIADVTEADKRTSAMGLIGMAFGLGFAFGPFLGAGAAGLGGALWPDIPVQTLPGVFAAVLCLADLIWVIRGLPESLPKEEREKRTASAVSRRFATFGQLRHYLGHRTIGPMILLFFILTFAFSNLEMAFVLYAADKKDGLGLSTAQVYYVFMYIGILLAFVHGYVIRKASKKLSDSALVMSGIALQIVGFALIPLESTLSYLLIGMGILCFGQGICNPSLLSAISKATPDDRQGEVMGVTQWASSLARIIGPIFAGVLIEVLGFRWPFWAAGIIMIGALAVAFDARRRLGPGEARKAEPEPTAGEA